MVVAVVDCVGMADVIAVAPAMPGRSVVLVVLVVPAEGRKPARGILAAPVGSPGATIRVVIEPVGM